MKINPKQLTIFPSIQFYGTNYELNLLFVALFFLVLYRFESYSYCFLLGAEFILSFLGLYPARVYCRFISIDQKPSFCNVIEGHYALYVDEECRSF